VGDAKHVADMFTGLGTFAFAMKAKVSAYEGSRDLILAMKSASDRAATLFTTEHRDLFRRPLMGKELDVFDAVVIDPPRAGAKEQMEELAKSKVPVIVSVSCNPATFARDARILVEGGYTLEWIKPVGQFRWSTHAELVALLRK
jgi:23S rRNA (uracil1939-C5)-methyltransferase